jgi:hypothetical protein
MSNIAVNNCYRSILAQINCLDSVYSRKNHLIEIYEEISELALYIMENDEQRICMSIEQIKLAVDELEYCLLEEYQETEAIIKMILDEIRTHLQYLLIQFQSVSYKKIKENNNAQQ